MHPSVGSSGLGTSCSPSPPKSILSQSAPADVNAFLHCDADAADDVRSEQVRKHAGVGVAYLWWLEYEFLLFSMASRR